MNCPNYLYTNLSDQNIPEIHWAYWSSSVSYSSRGKHNAYIAHFGGQVNYANYHSVYSKDGGNFGFIGIRPVIMISKEKDE